MAQEGADTQGARQTRTQRSPADLLWRAHPTRGATEEGAASPGEEDSEAAGAATEKTGS